jgi:hypothetical protein
MANLAFKLLKTTPTSSFRFVVNGAEYTYAQVATTKVFGPVSEYDEDIYHVIILNDINTDPMAVQINADDVLTVKVGSKYSASQTVSSTFLYTNDYYVFTEDSVFITVKETNSFITNAADYSQSKKTLGKLVPENAITSAWQRYEPVITPEQLRTRHLFGIPLVSRTKDPITGKPMVMTEDILHDMIIRAVSLVETEGNFDIFPVKYREKTAFDRNAFDSFGYMELKRRPVASVDKLTVTPSNQVDVYQVPQAWIEASGFQRGQVNIVPLTIAFTNGGFIPSQSAGGAAFLSILGAKGWIPAYWQIEYTTGFADGQVPRDLNELIGVVAAIETLSLLATTDADANSRSIGIDGLSQSVSSAGPQKYQARIEVLNAKKQMLIDKFKGRFALKMFSSNV